MKNNDNVIETTKIYLITNCYGDPNKVYIGKTKNVRERKNEHNKNYGDESNFIIIDEINSLDSKDWKPLECKWIQHYQDLGYDIQNKNKGGSGSPCGIKRSKEFCDNLSKTHKGRVWSKEHKLHHKKSLKARKMPEGFGKKPEGYGEKVSKSNIGIPKPKPEGFGKLISIIHKGKKRSEETKLNISLSLMGNSFRSKPVLQYDLEGNFIKEWSSMKEATDYINDGRGGGVGCCCRGEQKKAYGYQWKFKD